MTTLAVDFARALKDLAAIMNDLKHLATLGTLPLVLVNPTTLRVRFPGCDRDTVETLCVELGIRRGIVGQDEDFDTQHGADMALRFPFAPSKTASEADLCDIYDGWRPAKRTKREAVEWHGMISAQQSQQSEDSFRSLNHDFQPTSPGLQPQAQAQEVLGLMTGDGDIIENPWLGSRPVSAQMSDYSSLHVSDDVAMHFEPEHRQYSSKWTHHGASQTEYEGIEGIHKFIEHCDRARR